MADKKLFHEISAPSLTSSSYGADIEKVFDDINKNFQILSQKAVRTGSDGRGLKIDTLTLSGSQELLEAIKNTIKNGTEPQAIGGVNYDVDLENYKVTVYEVFDEDTAKYTIVGSEPIIYRDPRFSNLNRVGNCDSAQDLSCILYLTYGNGSVSVERFDGLPTLKFNSEEDYFTWHLNGVDTGLIAQGPKGDDGRTFKCHLCKVNTDNEITAVYSGGAWKSNTEDLVNADFMNMDVVIAVNPDEQAGDSYSHYYIGVYNYEEGRHKLQSGIKIPGVLNNGVLNAWMKDYGFDGYYLPVENGSNTNAFHHIKSEAPNDSQSKTELLIDGSLISQNPFVKIKGYDRVETYAAVTIPTSSAGSAGKTVVATERSAYIGPGNTPVTVNVRKPGNEYYIDGASRSNIKEGMIEMKTGAVIVTVAEQSTSVDGSDMYKITLRPTDRFNNYFNDSDPVSMTFCYGAANGSVCVGEGLMSYEQPQSVVIGRYNQNVGNGLFVIGNGGTDRRSNIMDVTQDEVNVMKKLNVKDLLTISVKEITNAGYATYDIPAEELKSVLSIKSSYSGENNAVANFTLPASVDNGTLVIIKNTGGGEHRNFTVTTKDGNKAVTLGSTAIFVKASDGWI